MTTKPGPRSSASSRPRAAARAATAKAKPKVKAKAKPKVNPKAKSKPAPPKAKAATASHSSSGASTKSERCSWARSTPLYESYHDEEWGVPHGDDRLMFEKLTLEAFQSGLSWITILRKRDNFRKAFDNFDAAKIARYGKRDFNRLMNDEGIVRNRLKIEATISNAAVIVELTRRQSFAGYLWGFLPEGPIINERQSMADVPGQTELSKAISKALKKDGFRFVGPTTMYAFMQSMGMVNDHVMSCPRYRPCAKAQRAFKRPTA